jgi:secretion/DNA translocation related TadE-like protein
VLALAIVVAVVTLTALALPIYIGLAAKQRAVGAADAAALAAADVAVGLIPGFPCERAAEVAAANGGVVSSCEVDGLVVTVSVGATIPPFSVVATATAGPP